MLKWQHKFNYACSTPGCRFTCQRKPFPAHSVPLLSVLLCSGPPYCSQHSTDTSPLMVLLLCLSHTLLASTIVCVSVVSCTIPNKSWHHFVWLNRFCANYSIYMWLTPWCAHRSVAQIARPDPSDPMTHTDTPVDSHGKEDVQESICLSIQSNIVVLRSMVCVQNSWI